MVYIKVAKALSKRVRAWGGGSLNGVEHRVFRTASLGRMGCA